MKAELETKRRAIFAAVSAIIFDTVFRPFVEADIYSKRRATFVAVTAAMLIFAEAELDTK
jgi:hypothetical protein